MAITIKIGKAAAAPSVTLELDIRKSMNGDLMIFDHGDIDIVLSASKNTLQKFNQIIISYHFGYKNIAEKLRSLGFTVTHSKPRYYHRSQQRPSNMFLGHIYANKIIR